MPEPVITVDCHYVVPEHAASYLLVEGTEAAFIDTNTVHAVPYLLEALKEAGLAPDHVRWIIPTHLHLDHAGGTSALLAQCPNATVLSHPRGVRHFIEPSRLIESVRSVYGDADYERLYAPITPIEPSRVRGVGDNETLVFGHRTLTFMHTRGHSNHHICIYDTFSNGVFSGDAFGVEYRRSRSSKHPFLLCSTAPPDFEPVEARATIQRILATGAQRVYVAHYGEVTEVGDAAEVLMASIKRMEALRDAAAATSLEGEELQEFCARGISQAVRELVELCEVQFDERDAHLVNTYRRIDAQGIAVAAARKRVDR